MSQILPDSAKDNLWLEEIITAIWTRWKGQEKITRMREDYFYKMSGFTRLTDSVEKGFIGVKSLFVVIKNFENCPLTAYPEQSIITFKSDVQGERARISLDIYKDVIGGKDGVPVVISCELNDKTYLLCVESDSVILKEIEVPEIIPSETSEFIFFKRNLCEKFRTFESSSMSGFFLALSEEDQSLTLKPYDEDKQDLFTFLLEPSKLESFKASPIITIPCHFWNNFHDLLIAHPEESIAKFEPEGHVEVEKATFFLDTYRELALTNKGIPMTISCKVDNKTYLLHAENNSVILKERELPKEIPTKNSELIFYRAYFSDGKSSCRFESSSNENFCLACNIEDPEKKLMLKKYAVNDIDETMKFDLEEEANEPAL
ncbi:uncharacterized protein LOC130294632 isoform X2 [Hyla sarda]|uniref:uncharacterized protein LOC130294632 isoform X2 n=1 Tax=Hyla sarda TaxID=327740 RepID=UPI0024C43785|nr:uncharacterized protein LOC130294632 isoform X2 [Hyla sarda]